MTSGPMPIYSVRPLALFCSATHQLVAFTYKELKVKH
jgi:hypothetical protein